MTKLTRYCYMENGSNVTVVLMLLLAYYRIVDRIDFDFAAA